MSRIPQHIIDEIFQTARIEEVISSFVQLKKAGSNLKGLSPFTDEKTPSFVVSPAKQIFKCFSSGKGGTVVSFLMEKEQFSYPESLRWLAEKYNIEIPAEKELSAEEMAVLNEKESLFIINDFAKKYFCENLINTDEGKSIGLSYFKERGFSTDTINKFELGYCLNSSNAFSTEAGKNGYKQEYLEKLGLIKTKENKSFDFFRGRIIFPIHSASGRVLGFGARTLLKEKKIAKYFNSPENPIYNKSEILYGLYYSKGGIIKNDNCYICEGYTDVISLFQSGISNVVSSSGTSLTKGQIKLIQRYTKNITILYDGDSAGIKASFRGIDLILEQGLNVKIVLFPEGEDPDSFAKNHSETELKNFLIEEAQDFISFKSSVLLKDAQEDPIKKASLIREIIKSISLIPNAITRSVYVQKVSLIFNINENTITHELLQLRQKSIIQEYPSAQIKTKASQSNNPSPQKHKTNNYIHEFELARLLIKYGTVALFKAKENEETPDTTVIELICQELGNDELHFENSIHQKLLNIYLDGLTQNKLYSSDYFKRLEDDEIVQLVTNIETSEQELSNKWLSEYKIDTKTEADHLYDTIITAIYNFKTYHISKKIRMITKELESNPKLTEEETIELLNKQMDFEKVKRIFAEKLGRTILG